MLVADLSAKLQAALQEDPPPAAAAAAAAAAAELDALARLHDLSRSRGGPPGPGFGGYFGRGSGGGGAVAGLFKGPEWDPVLRFLVAAACAPVFLQAWASSVCPRARWHS
jgi:hypothetical protein